LTCRSKWSTVIAQAKAGEIVVSDQEPGVYAGR
jgi:hypothetical protein